MIPSGGCCMVPSLLCRLLDIRPGGIRCTWRYCAYRSGQQQYSRTAIKAWSTKDTLQECNITNVDSRFYNAMINPYTVGPMALVGFTWYQGEANVDEVKGTFGASRYACTFPAMIKEWRRAFKNPEAFFWFRSAIDLVWEWRVDRRDAHKWSNVCTLPSQRWLCN